VPPEGEAPVESGVAPEPDAAPEAGPAPGDESEPEPTLEQEPEPAPEADPAPEPEPERAPEPEPQLELELTPEPEAESIPDPEPEPAEEEAPASYPSLAPLSLGNMGETRRESVARRLRALRERSPRPPGAPAFPAPDEEGADSGDGSLRENLAGRAGALGGGLSGARDRAAGAWHSVPTVARQRIAAAAIVAVVFLVVVLVVLPAAPCEAPGGDECAPGDDAIALVPDDAFAYAHADIDPDTEQYREASAIASRLPLLSRVALAGVVDELGRVDFASQVLPWAGGELALAVLPGTGSLARVVMIEADDPDAATAFAAELLGPGAETTQVGSVDVTTAGRTSSAIVDGFLLLGDAGAVASMADPEEGGGTLAESPAATEALDELDDDLVASAYLSGPGARALLADPGLSSLNTFVDASATSGVAVGVSAADGVLEVESRSVLDPERAGASPSFFAALPPFAPELPNDVGSDALAYLGLGDPGTSVDALLTQAAADAPELVVAFESLEKDLKRDTGISLRDDILPLLGSEAALSLEPLSAEGEPPAPGTIAPSGVPYVSLIADGIDAATAARSLANLQEPLVTALSASQGAPIAGFETAKIAGVDAQSLAVSPEVNLTYAVYDDRLVIATNPIGIEQARAEGDGLEAAAAFEQVTADLPEEVSVLAFLDLRGLISLGEEIGLGADPAYATYAPDLRALEAAAMAVTDADGTIRTDLRIAVGEPAAPEVESSPLGAE